MLKIKEGKLKKLCKYGFKNMKYLKDVYIRELIADDILDDSLIMKVENGVIHIIGGENYEDTSDLDALYDLIVDGLVEKVSDKK